MDPLEIISEYYTPETVLFDILVTHGKQVAAKAVDAAQQVPHLKPDLEFIREAAMLHDVGIFLTAAPSLGCEGDHPYICHGFLGRELLEQKGLHRHGLVCEHHIGVGLTAEEIKEQNHPLPDRDMIPENIDELVISYADKFYSKSNGMADGEKSVEAVRGEMLKYGADKAERFDLWHRLLGCAPPKPKLWQKFSRKLK